MEEGGATGRAGTHRGVLALHAGAVEAQGGHPLLAALDVEDTLVPALPGLRLRQVLGLQRDGLDHLHGHQDLVHSQQLGAVLGTETTAQVGAGSQRCQRLLPGASPDLTCMFTPFLPPTNTPRTVLGTSAHPQPLREGRGLRDSGSRSHHLEASSPGGCPCPPGSVLMPSRL